MPFELGPNGHLNGHDTHSPFSLESSSVPVLVNESTSSHIIARDLFGLHVAFLGDNRFNTNVPALAWLLGIKGAALSFISPPLLSLRKWDIDNIKGSGGLITPIKTLEELRIMNADILVASDLDLMELYNFAHNENNPSQHIYPSLRRVFQNKFQISQEWAAEFPHQMLVHIALSDRERISAISAEVEQLQPPRVLDHREFLVNVLSGSLVS